MYKVSIIIPVFNSKEYLSTCIESVIDQTFTNWELILVDDGSTDGSSEVCDAYSKLEARIKVYHQHNQGVSCARNKGIIESKGDFILFIDSDDFIERNYISSFYDIQRLTGADWVIQGYKGGGDLPNVCVVREDFEKLISIYQLTNRKGCCLKLFKRKLLIDNEIRFNNGICIGEDFIFNLSYLLTTNKVVMSNIKLYNRTIRCNSLSRSTHTTEVAFGAYNAFILIAEKVIHELHLTSKAKEILLSESILYTDSILNSIAHIQSKKERFDNYKRLNLDVYATHKESHTFAENILVKLICHKQFKIYDFLTQFFSNYDKF